MILKHFQELRTRGQILRQKMLSLILSLRKFQGFGNCDPGTVNRYQIYIWDCGNHTHTHTHTSSVDSKLWGLIILALTVSHASVTPLLSAGKTQPEHCFADIVSNSFYMLPGGSVEQRCNLHICWPLLPQSWITIFCLDMCPMNLSWTGKRHNGTKYSEIQVAGYLIS